MSPISLRLHGITLAPESARVILRPSIPSNPRLINNIIRRALALTEDDAQRGLDTVLQEFQFRHFNIESLLLNHYEKIRHHISTSQPLTPARQLLLGALFSGEYALESAALFNPSIVPHPDQQGIPEGALRFVMSLRATGEGHISSIEFRSGLILPGGSITLDAVTGFVTQPEVISNPRYRKKNFIQKLKEMDCENEHSIAAMNQLADTFTRSELSHSMDFLRREKLSLTPDVNRILDCMKWLADSNYELSFSESHSMSERIIFPVSPNESNGIEDARFVRFVDDDGTVTYYATYTAYNGRTILPQLIETTDFLHFRVLTLNGSAVQNKGMALFPRRINGRYAMLSRQDDENLFIMFSDNLHFWYDYQMLMQPAEIWESVKIGNCGSPIETEAGWLVITHGVGPLRKYCIGAALLDLNDPTHIIGRLSEPLLSPKGNEREGYVPNVVYSCGALVHGGELVLPYAMSDKASAIVSVPMDELMAALQVGQTNQTPATVPSAMFA